MSIKTLTLATAIGYIKQTSQTSSRPFFFMVGAGISYPPIKLAREIEEDCRVRATQQGRNTPPIGAAPIDTYSHWFEQAYHSPADRQAYLRKMIEGTYISHANLRLAHILLSKRVANLVFTTNFDDLLSRALSLFGISHIVYDQPETFQRIDPEREDIQIVHVHGSYRFYDCCNLKEEILQRSDQDQSDMGSIIEHTLSRRAPIVVGYSGWEGDVFISALHRRLERDLPFNLYWFCHNEHSLDALPAWLREHRNVYFVTPNPVQRDIEIAYATKRGGGLGIGQTLSAIPERELEQTIKTGPRKTRSVLLARDIFDGFIQAFKLQAPDLTKDPLGYFSAQLRISLPQDKRIMVEDIYGLRGVIQRLDRAKKLEHEEITKALQQQLERVRNALRDSNYEEVTSSAADIDATELSSEQLKEIFNALGLAVEDLDGKPGEQATAYDIIIQGARLIGRARIDTSTRRIIAKAFIGRGLGLAEQRQFQAALKKFESVIHRARNSTDKELRLALAVAMINKGAVLNALGRNQDALAVYERVVERFGRARGTILQAGVVRAIFNQALILMMLNRNQEAISLYRKVVRRFGAVSDVDILEVVSAALLNKGYAHGALGEWSREINSYEEIVARFERMSEPSLQVSVAKALVNKAISLQKRLQFGDAVKVCDEVMRRFGKVNSPIQYSVARSLLVKGSALANQGRITESIRTFEEVATRYRDTPYPILQYDIAAALVMKGNQLLNGALAIDVFDDVVRRFELSSDPGLKEQVAMALLNKAGRWFQAYEHQEAIKICREVDRRFGRSPNASAKGLVAIALGNEAGFLIQANRNKLGIRVADNLVERFSEMEADSVQEQVANALFNKGIALTKLKSLEAANVVYDRLIDSYRYSKNAAINLRSASALLHKSQNLYHLERNRDAIAQVNRIVIRFGTSKDLELKEIVAKALLLKGDALGKQLRHDEAIGLYRKIVRSFGYPGSTLRGLVTNAINGTGFQILCKAKRDLLNDRSQSARLLLTKAKTTLTTALTRGPSDELLPYVLGNLAYVAFLQNNETRAMDLIERAISIGGERLRKAELKDTVIYELYNDLVFRRLIRSVDL